MDPSMYALNQALEDDHWWFRGRRAIFLEVLARHLPPSPGGTTSAIVELGCGTGGNLAALSRFGQVTGVEPDPGAAEWARRKTGLHVIVDKLPECPSLPEGAFDVVGLFDVLEHIDDDRGALRRIARLLRPRGVAIVSVPAFPWLWTRHDESLHHVRRYTRAGLADALGDAGLSWDAGGYFNFRLFPLVAAVRLLHRATGGGPPHDFRIPPRLLNHILERIFAGEARRVADHGYPWGVSLLALARANS